MLLVELDLYLELVLGLEGLLDGLLLVLVGAGPVEELAGAALRDWCPPPPAPLGFSPFYSLHYRLNSATGICLIYFLRLSCPSLA